MSDAASTVVSGVAGAVTGFVVGGPVGAVAGGVAGVAGSLANQERGDAAEQAYAAQRKAAAISNAQQAIERARQVRMALAQERVVRARMQARAFAGGPEGAGQAATGDVATAVGAANTQAGAQFGISRAEAMAQQFRLESKSTNIWDTVAGIGQLAGGIASANKQGKFDGLFG